MSDAQKTDEVGTFPAAACSTPVKCRDCANFSDPGTLCSVIVGKCLAGHGTVAAITIAEFCNEFIPANVKAQGIGTK